MVLIAVVEGCFEVAVFFEVATLPTSFVELKLVRRSLVLMTTAHLLSLGYSCSRLF